MFYCGQMPGMTCSYHGAKNNCFTYEIFLFQPCSRLFGSGDLDEEHKSEFKSDLVFGQKVRDHSCCKMDISLSKKSIYAD